MTTTIRGTDNSAAAPALTGNDPDTGIYFPAANTLGLVTGGSEAVRVDSSGNVGIGTNSPASELQVSNTSGYSTVTVTGNSANGGVLSFVDSAGVTTQRILGFGSTAGENTSLRFDTNGSEKMRIDSSGNVGIGTSSPTAYSGYATIAFNGSNGGVIEFQQSGVQKARISNAGGAVLQFATNDTERMRIDSSGNLLVGGTLNNSYRSIFTLTSANNVTDVLALHNGSNASGTGTGARLLFKLANFENAVENRKYASIEGISTASFNEAIALVFKTQASASGGDPVERMRIDSSGNVGIGTSSPSSKLHVQGSFYAGDSSFVGAQPSWMVDKATDVSLSSFASGANPTYAWNSSELTWKFQNYNNCLTIAVGGTLNDRNANIQVGHNATGLYSQYYGSLYLNKLGGTVYANTTSISDLRKKENIQPIVDAVSKIQKLTGYTFNMIDVDPEKRQAGLVAQEVIEVLPEAVTYEESEDFYGVSYHMLSALYVEAIKELKTITDTQAQTIAALEARIAVLEGN